MNLGFTGPETALTQAQRDTLATLIGLANRPRFHTGDCIGADVDATKLAEALGCWTVGHPPTDEKKRANLWYHSRREPAPYLTRNRHIVDACDLLIVAVRTQVHDRCRDGFCATYRCARRQGRPITVILPDGTSYSVAS
jgi:hypothetical protein